MCAKPFAGTHSSRGDQDKFEQTMKGFGIDLPFLLQSITTLREEVTEAKGMAETEQERVEKLRLASLSR